MADAPLNPDLEDALRLSGLPPEEQEQDIGPLYRVFEGSKIPVAKSMGQLCQSRIEQAKSSRLDIEDCWSEAFRYYENDQMSHRKGATDRAGGTRYGRGTSADSTTWTSTENVVFSNAVTMLPMLYAKNPAIECTAINPTNEPFVTAAEALINALLNMKDAPGLNFKNKARRGVLSAYLMNAAYLKLDWTQKQDSSEEAIAELQALSTQLEKAKNKKEINDVEGKIRALDEKVNFLSPSGPSVSLISPFRVYVDPTSLEPDHSDANWIAYYDYIPSSYLKAVYGRKVGEEYRSVYEPTHVLRAGSSTTAIEDEVNSFSLINQSSDIEGKSYGYRTKAAFNAAQYTKVWYYWDKTTRRVMLFSDADWTWPLWVWDDPLKLLGFFNLHRLHFHETLEGSQPKGEVTYYLDQQDTINDINSTLHQARNWAKRNIFFNKNVGITQKEVEEVLKGPDGTARGIDVPEGQKMSDVLFSLVPPAMAFPELLSTEQQFLAINRITGLNEALKGGQFKTNTTNKAVDTYQKNTDIRVDERIDAIEDWIGDFAWSLLQLCTRYWTQQDVAKIIGDEAAKGWQQIPDSAVLRTTLNMRIVGGSTDKPTSKAKKQEAIQIAQVLGQFGNGIPAVGLVVLRILSRAFNNEIVINQGDWDILIKSMEDAANSAGAGPGGAGGAQGGDPNAPVDVKEKMKQLIDSLPPEGKAKLQELVDGGMAPKAALEQVLEHAKNAPQPEAAPQQPPQ